jgi:hypothetical protein
MRKKQRYYDRFMAMTDAQRDAEVATFDREDMTPGQPLTPRDLAVHARAGRKGGRPRIGAGARVVSVSMERMLLREVDVAAQRRGLSRAQFLARAVRRELASVT